MGEVDELEVEQAVTDHLTRRRESHTHACVGHESAAQLAVSSINHLREKVSEESAHLRGALAGGAQRIAKDDVSQRVVMSEVCVLGVWCVLVVGRGRHTTRTPVC